MRKRIVDIMILACSIAALSACGKDNMNLVENEAPSAQAISQNTSSSNSDGNNYTKPEEVTLKGNYDSIFSNEIKTEKTADPHIVINGYDFRIDSSSYVNYFDNIGPVVIVGEQLQFKIKVQDKTFDEVKSSDITAKAVAAGYEITEGPLTVNESDLEYIWFAYDTGIERGVAINMPGPDSNHAIGVQIAILDDSVSNKAAIDAAMLTAGTVTLTNAEDSTKEDIEKMYGSSNTVSGISLDSYTINYKGSSYTHPVPSGFYQSYEDIDEDSYLAFYDSSDIDVTITYRTSGTLANSKECIDTILMWRMGEVIEQQTIGDVSYAILYEEEFHYYELNAAKLVDGYIFSLSAECDSNERKLDFEDIQGFFIPKENVTEEESSDGLGPHTGIKHDQLYMGSVKDEETALSLIAQYGEMQRERYDNSLVKDIEDNLQAKYGITSVNLGELDIETAKDIERGISYMFDTYPIMKGSLNTFSLANLTGREGGYIALTQTADFIIENDEGIPKVVRNEIILNANKWLNREQMLGMCKENVASGYWCENATDPSKIIVHELGHQLLNVLRAKEYGFVSSIDSSVYMPTLLNESNKEAYLQYYWAGTALNQDLEKGLMQDAYNEWKSSGNKGTEEDFRLSISKYANGTQSDGGISYHETFAEAIADVYCNGDNAADASKMVIKQVEKRLK